MDSYSTRKVVNILNFLYFCILRFAIRANEKKGEGRLSQERKKQRWEVKQWELKTEQQSDDKHAEYSCGNNEMTVGMAAGVAE